MKYILFIIILFILTYFSYKVSYKLNDYVYGKYITKKYNITSDTKYFNIEIYPELNNIKKYNIDNELDLLLKKNLTDWSDWPEKNLYNSQKNIWKIMPFYYYGYWFESNCNKMPNLTNFLKKLKTIKIALLSVLSPRTTLKQHKGWGSHSNNVLRCHYGLQVPNNCYMNVKNDNEFIGTIQPHKKDEWLIFDDSKTHFASNDSDEYRIILIIDLDRPSYVPVGKSDIGDSKELLEIVKYFKENK